MSLSHRYRQLAAFIEALESHGITVQEAAPVEKAAPAGDEDEDASSDGRFSVQLCVELPVDDTVSRLDLEHVDRAEASEHPPNEPVGVHTSPPVEARTGDERRIDGIGATDDSDNSVADDSDDPVADDSDDPVADDSDDPVADDVEDSDTVEHSDNSDDADDSDDSVTDETEQTEPSDATSADGEVTADAVHVENEDTGDDTPPGEDGVPCTHHDCDRTFETERGMKIHRTKAHPLSEQADQAADRTVHHDPELLARVYDEYETFAEMTAALDVDVGAQAVRKQMIRHGIHEPGGSGTSHAGEDTHPATDADTGSDGGGGRTGGDDSGDADEPASDGDTSGNSHDTDDASVRTDSLSRTGAGPGESSPATETDTDVEFEFIADRLPERGVPESLSTEDLQLAVEEATTLFDVQRALGLDQATTRDVLSEYDLLELVSGRAAALRDREELKDEIGQRIHRTAT